MTDRRSEHANQAIAVDSSTLRHRAWGVVGWEARATKEGCLISNTDLYNRSHYIFGNVSKCSLFLQRKLEKIV